MIDLLVKLLQCSLREGDEQLHMIRIFKETYDVLHAYMLGRSRKNALYIAKYIDFFQTQFTQKVIVKPADVCKSEDTASLIFLCLCVCCIL